MVPLRILERLFVLIIIASNIRQGYGYSRDMDAQGVNELVLYFSIVKIKILIIFRVILFCFMKQIMRIV